MSSLKDSLTAHYTLKDSIKAYKGYKVKPPEKTIDFIESAFEKVGLNVSYTPKENQLLRRYFPFQAGAAVLFPKGNDKMILLRSGGKGVTPILARASATAELIERFSGYGLARGNINHYLPGMKRHQIWTRKRGKNDEIENEFPFYSPGTSDPVPEKLRRKYENLAKSVCYSLTRNKFFSYPEEFITTSEGSNGMASGNTMEEAVIHAICEVIERLGAMYVLDNQPKYNTISKESITHPTVKKLMKAIESAGLEFEMLDFSHLFNIPVIVTIFDHPQWNFPTNPYTNVYCEFPKMIIGVDTDPQDAAMRCFTEVVQAAEPVNSAANQYCKVQDQFIISKISMPVRLENYLKTAYSTFQNGNQPLSVNLRNYLKSDHGEISIQDIKSIYDINHRIEIKRIIKNLKKCNIEVFVHDITNPALKFPVTRVILSGGKDYFSQIPLIGYRHLVLGAKDKQRRYSYLNSFNKQIVVQRSLSKIFREEKWCKATDQNDLIDRVIANLCYTGVDPPLWGKSIDKFYFLGMLYLRTEKYEQAKHCFNAALYNNFNEIPFLLGMAYIFSKQGTPKEYKDVIDHIQTVNKMSINVDMALKEFEEPVIDPNPFEPCDLRCDKKNKPHLCENCFFNYVSEDVFMRNIIDDLRP